MVPRIYRHELKFLCEERQLFLIENRIRHICMPDPHGGKTGSYRVKSLYFDTFDNQCYQEIQAGADSRKKYRIRIYNDDTDMINLECKYSLHDRKTKETCRISRQQCTDLMEKLPGGQLNFTQTPMPDFEEDNLPKTACRQAIPLLQRFLLEKRMELLMPKVIVEYRRTPYVFPGGNVRITFDRSIRSSCQTDRFLDGNAVFKGILPENVHILEVKYDEGLPGAVRELVTAGQQLCRTSFSKYGLCREYGIG